jgi:hypothetical protein
VHYIEEDDVILIGPGMERGEETKRIVNELLAKYPDKKWVVDGGALQEVDASLLNKNMIITPNVKEMEILLNHYTIKPLHHLGITVLAGAGGLCKWGKVGGSAGMKGGTGMCSGPWRGYAKSQQVRSGLLG